VNLDCHTRESALRSISELYVVPAADIDAFLIGVDLEAYYEEFAPAAPGDVTITALLEEEFGHAERELSQVSWFHLTRVLASEQFAQGILPLADALEGIWGTLFSVFHNSVHSDNLRLLRQSGVPNFQYNLKVGKPVHGGPYAMLVREVAFRAKEIGNHDYLEFPEIIEDICLGYEKRFGVSIQDKVTAALLPCIVKFRSDRVIRRGCIEAAVYYLYLTGRGERLSMYANTCYDGRNTPVPREQIIDVEFV